MSYVCFIAIGLHIVRYKIKKQLIVVSAADLLHCIVITAMPEILMERYASNGFTASPMFAIILIFFSRAL